MKRILPFCLLGFHVLGILAQEHEPRLVVPIGHTKGITAVDVSPNGDFILTGSIDHKAKIWDWSGHEIHTLLGHDGEVLTVAFSPKNADDPDGGKYILTGSSDYTAILRDEHGEQIKIFEEHKGRVTSVAFSPDAKYCLTGSEDKTARLWNSSTAASQTFQHPDVVNSVAFSPDGKFILTACKDKTAMLWQRSGARQLTFSGGHTAAVLCAVFSPGGDSILTGAADGTAILWNLKGVKLHTFQHAKEIRSVAFSPDGKKIVTASSDGTLNVWDHLSKEPLTIKTYIRGRMEGSPGMAQGVKFSTDGRYIITASEREPAAKILEVSTGNVYLSLKGHTSAIASLALSPDGLSLLTGHDDKTTKIWRVMSQEVQSFRYAGKPVSLAFSPETTLDSAGGRFILIGSEDKGAWLQDLSGSDISSFKPANRAVFSPDGKSVLTGHIDGTTKVWDLATREAVTLTHSEKKVTALAFSPNGKSFAIGSDDGAIIFWDSAGASPVLFPKSTNSAITALAFAPDGNSIVCGAESGLTEIRTLSGELKKGYPGRFANSKNVNSIAFSPKSPKDKNGGRFVLKTTGNDAEFWELESNQVITFSGHTSDVNAVAFSPEGENILTGSKDGTVKIWNIESRKEIATLVAIDSIDWVVLHPSGLFDASPGAMRQIYYLYGEELLEFKQLKTRFYEPYLFQKILGIKPGGLRPVDELGAVKFYPEVCEWSIKKDSLHVMLTPRSGGIGKVALLLDRTELLADANPARKSSFVVDLKPFAGHYSTQKPNQFHLVLYNEGGDLPSLPYPLDPEVVNANDYGVTAKDPSAPATVRKPLNAHSDKGLENIHLYALMVGTSKYADEKLDLKYPEKDAAMFEDALKKAGGELFKERTVIRLLSTADANPTHWPRKKEIREAIHDIASKAGPDDILLIYFSGHGLTYKAPNSEESQFYYLTTDVSSADLSEPAMLNSKGVAQDSLMDWVRKVKARKRILIYDACNSGSVVEKMGGAKDLTSDQRKALERINERSGMFILTGSAADKSSYEANTYGHGLLTYSLLNGMIQVAAENGGDVELGALFDFVVDNVSELAKKIDREQRPEVIQAESYPIGQIKENTGIKPPNELHVFVRTSLNVSKEGVDLFEVSKIVNAELDKSAGEKNPSLVFWGDVSSFSGKYYFIGGEYQEEGEKITGTANLYQGKTKLKSFPISFKKGKEKEWAKDLVFELREYLLTHPPK